MTNLKDALKQAGLKADFGPTQVGEFDPYCLLGCTIGCIISCVNGCFWGGAPPDPQN